MSKKQKKRHNKRVNVINRDTDREQRSRKGYKSEFAGGLRERTDWMAESKVESGIVRQSTVTVYRKKF